MSFILQPPFAVPLPKSHVNQPLYERFLTSAAAIISLLITRHALIDCQASHLLDDPTTRTIRGCHSG
jgi:hypothetical protein